MNQLTGRIVEVEPLGLPISQGQIAAAARHAAEKGYQGIRFNCMGVTITVHADGTHSHRAPAGRVIEPMTARPETPRQDRSRA